MNRCSKAAEYRPGGKRAQFKAVVRVAELSPASADNGCISRWKTYERKVEECSDANYAIHWASLCFIQWMQKSSF